METTYDLNEKFLDYDNFIEEFFGSEPSEKNSVMVSLDCDNITELFEKLVLLFKDGLVFFFAGEDKKINLEDLSSDQIEHINKYFNSLFMNVNFKILSIKDIEKYENEIINTTNAITVSYMVNEGDTDSTPYKMELIDLLDYKHLMSNLLEDRRFRLRKGNYVYIIWFNMLKPEKK